jgi:hypothetical protein
MRTAFICLGQEATVGSYVLGNESLLSIEQEHVGITLRSLATSSY